MIVFAAGSLNPLAVNPGLILWTLIIFLLVVIVLRFAAWGPLTKALDARAEKIHNDLDKAASDREEAEKVLAQRQKELDKQLGEAQAIIAEGKKDAEALRDDIVSKANAEAAAIKDRAVKEIEQAKLAAVDELKTSAVQLAVGLAGRLIGEKISEETHKDFLEKAVKEYQELN